MQRRGESEQLAKGQRQRTKPKARKVPTARVSEANLKGQLDQRTRELREALDQQAAIGEILRAILNSPGDVQPVLDTVAKHAARICGAQFVDIILVENNMMRVGATFGDLERPLGELMPLNRSTVMGRSICDMQPVQVADLQNAGDDFALGREFAIRFGHRSILGVPLIREGRALGTILVRRTEVRSFDQKNIALLTTFADQAVIAIENARLLNELHQRTDDLSESLEQQTATSEVLEVISRSPVELRLVFETMLANAVRVCGAKFGTMHLYDGGTFRSVAMHNVPPGFAEMRKKNPIIHPSPQTGLGRAARTKQVVQIPDLTIEQPYRERDPASVAMVELAGARTLVVVPMLKEDVLLGTIAIYRQEVRPFTDKQIELVQNFAAQAVIAIENARLLNELRQRTDDLSESLEQQTATSEVLKVISSSPGELEPVFDTMLTNATRICEAKFGTLYLRDGDGLRAVAVTRDAPPAYVEARKQTGVSPDGPVRRAATTKQVVHITDIKELQSYHDGHPSTVASVELGKFRTVLAVPMLKDDELIGIVTINRQQVRPFTDKQIELVKNFAAQAVIAIENTRLLKELRQRTDDLSESLEQQTATSEILRVISSSEGELEPVFQTMLANATRICEAAFGSMLLYEDELFRRVATHNPPPMFAEYHKSTPTLDPEKIPDLKLIVETKQPVHVADAAAVSLDAPIVKYAGARSLLVVPLLKDGDLLVSPGTERGPRNRDSTSP